MDLTVTQKRENGLLDRTEVYFSISHPEGGTPKRAEIRKTLAAGLDAKDGVIILDWARSEFGRTVTRGYAKVYKSKDRAMALETSPILIRNGLMAAVAKAEPPPKEPPAAPAARKEAPKEASKEAPKEAPKGAPKEAPKPDAPKKEAAAKPSVPPAVKEAPKKEAAAKGEKKETPKEKEPAKEKRSAKKESK